MWIIWQEFPGRYVGIILEIMNENHSGQTTTPFEIISKNVDHRGEAFMSVLQYHL